MKKRILNRKRLLLLLATLLIVFGIQESYSQTLTASTPRPLTEATLHESVVTLTLNGGTYERSKIKVGEAVTVSGVPGVRVGTFGPAWFGVDRISDTRITVELGFDGNIDTDATLTFAVGAAAIVNYNGPALTTQISVSDSTETSEPSRDGGNTQQPVGPEQSEAPAADSEQDYIEGPWLWMVVPTDAAGGAGISTEFDSLADASGGKITEAYIAQNGVSEGDSIRQSRWTSGETYWSNHQCRKYDVKRTPNPLLQILTLGLLQDECIDPTVCWADNISTVVRTLGLRTGTHTGARTAYAWINLISPSEQSGVILTAQSGDALKVWLNGKVVHREAAEAHRCRKVNVLLACDPEVCVSDPTLGESNPRAVDVTLKPGNNLLLVKVQQHGEYWDMGIGLTGDFTPSLSMPEPLVPPSEMSTETIKADVNADGTVNIADLVLVASNLGKTEQNAADVNGDGQVNIADLVLVAGALGTAAAAPTLHPDTLETLTSADVRLWLSEARHLKRTDVTTHRGVLFLEQLLVALIPKDTALLANYPNPFNPETWIPYQLAKDAEVTLTIYAMNGQVVRCLTLGHQPAGIYQERSRAAYWDGKNAVGEPVSSGVYFYTLAAGDFSVTRKMLIRK